MFVSIFIAAVIVSAFFDQQERRHRLELQIEYEKLGRKVPVVRPKLPVLESVANVVVGLILLEIGGLSIWTLLVTIGIAGSDLAGKIVPIETDLAAAFLAGGIALVILGGKGIRANRRYKRISERLD